MKRFSTKSVVEGAMLLGILVIMGLLSNLVPVIGIVTFAFLPIPIIFAIFKHGFKVALMVGFLSVIVLIVVGVNPISASLDSVYATFTGIALGYGFSKKLRPAITFILTSASILLAVIIIVFIMGSFLQIDVVGEAVEIQFILIENIIEAISENPGRLPFVEKILNINEATDLEEIMTQLRAQVNLLLPAVLIMASLIYGYLNFLLAGLVLKKFNINIEPLPVFREWNFSKWFLWIFVISVGLEVFVYPFIFGSYIPGVLTSINYNANQVALMAITIQGLAVGYFFLSKKIDSTFIKVIILFLSFTMIAPVIVLLGMMDFYWNLRHI